MAEPSSNSPLLQVEFFERGQDWVESLGALREKIAARRDVLVSELQGLDAGWETATPKPTEALLRIWRLSFYDRWLTQIQERVVQLSF